MERPRLGVGAFVGSLRHDSINRRLFEAMVEIAPQGMDLFEIPVVIFRTSTRIWKATFLVKSPFSETRFTNAMAWFL